MVMRYLSFLVAYCLKKVTTLSSHHIVTVVGVSVFLCLVAFWPFITGKTLSAGDNFSLMVPGKLYTAQSLWSGQLPLWNPYLFGGISWIGDINQSIFYPSTALFVFLHAAEALNVVVVFHVLVAFIGTYLLALKITRHSGASLVAAVVFAFSPQMAGSVNNISSLQSLSWMPWVVWASLHWKEGWRWTLVGVVVLTLHLLGGYPQHLIYTLVCAAVLSAAVSPGKWQDWLRYWLSVGMTTLGITGAVWLPFLETVQNSTRTIQTATQATVGSLHPLELIKMIVPAFFEYPRGGIKWGLSWSRPSNISLYFGWLFLMLGFVQLKMRSFSRVQIALWSLFGLGIVLSLGGFLPGYSLLQSLPLIGATRGPSTALMISALSGALLLAIFVLELPGQKTLKQWQLVLLAIAGVSMAAVALSFFGFAEFWHVVDLNLGGRLAASAFHTLERDQLIFRVISMGVLLSAVAGLASIFAWKYKQWGLLALLIGLDILLNTQGHYQFAPQAVYDRDFISNYGSFFGMYSPSSRTLIRNYNAPYTDFGAYWDATVVRAPFSDSYVDEKELANATRQIEMRYGITPDWNAVAGVPSITGYTTLLPQDVAERFGRENQPSLNNLPEIKPNNPLLQDWAVRWYLVDTFYPYPNETAETQGFRLVSESDNQRWRMYEMPFLSRFRYEDGTRVAYDGYTETPNSFEITALNKESQPKILLADRYDVGWKAWVNDQPTTLINTHGLRELPLQPGDNKILLKYQPWQWRVGVQMSLFSTALVLLYWVWQNRSERLGKKKK